MGLLDRVAETRRAPRTKDFSEPPFWLSDGLSLPLLSSTPLVGDTEKIQHNFEGYVQGAYKAGGPVFAVIRVRQMIFAEARFQWREIRQGRPGNLFGSRELELLERPWPGGTTGELLSRAIVTADLGGAFYATTADDNGRFGKAATGPGQRLVHMRPDWVTIAKTSRSGDPRALDARISSFIYQPPPTGNGLRQPDPVLLLPDEVLYFSPQIDPLSQFSGMSWVTSIISEIRGDKAATAHKLKFFDNGATLGGGFTAPADMPPDVFKTYVALFKEHHRGAGKAYETAFIGGGFNPFNTMADFKQLDFTNLQGRAETRIASAGGVHPTLVGFSEGLQGSSLNAGNFQAAARVTANITMRPLWRMFAASAQVITPPPRRPDGSVNDQANLWYDDRDIHFLHEDATDQAQIRQLDAQTLRTLVDGGYGPDAAVDFVKTNDLNSLVGSHSGLLPVQLQPPGTGGPQAPAEQTAEEKARSLVEMVQKVYLGVGTVLSVEEARALLNRAGAGLSARLPSDLNGSVNGQAGVRA